MEALTVRVACGGSGLRTCATTEMEGYSYSFRGSGWMERKGEESTTKTTDTWHGMGSGVMDFAWAIYPLGFVFPFVAGIIYGLPWWAAVFARL